MKKNKQRPKMSMPIKWVRKQTSRAAAVGKKSKMAFWCRVKLSMRAESRKLPMKGNKASGFFFGQEMMSMYHYLVCGQTKRRFSHVIDFLMFKVIGCDWLLSLIFALSLQKIRTLTCFQRDRSQRRSENREQRSQITRYLSWRNDFYTRNICRRQIVMKLQLVWGCQMHR